MRPLMIADEDLHLEELSTESPGAVAPGPRNGVLDPLVAFRLMLRMRLVEHALVAAWADGLVPGEYHSGIGEEGVVAGVTMHLRGQDTMALDHRSTAPLIARGVDPLALALEVVGSEAGMNRGRAGHMHLFEPAVHAGSDGIVGSSGPIAVGNALAIGLLHPGSVAIAFHGDGAVNQGMLMEAYNLAVAWQLPVVFVCKDNHWSITTHSSDLTGGTILDRARAFGLRVESVRGDRVDQVHAAAGRLIARARAGKGPGFLHATCHRPGGHFEGDPLVRMLRDPLGQASELAPGLLAGLRAPTGATRAKRAHGLGVLSTRVARAARDWTLRSGRDPLRHARTLISATDAAVIEAEEREEITSVVQQALAGLGNRPTFGVPLGGAR